MGGRYFFQHFMRLLRDRGGNFALMFALLTPVVFGLAGGAVDLVIYQRQHGQMQDAADSAALNRFGFRHAPRLPDKVVRVPYNLQPRYSSAIRLNFDLSSYLSWAGTRNQI